MRKALLRAAVFTVACASWGVWAPAHAAGGLFEALFGHRPRPVAYYQYAPEQGLRFYNTGPARVFAPARASAPHRRAAAPKAALQRAKTPVRPQPALRFAALNPTLGATGAAPSKLRCCRDGGDAGAAIGHDPTLRPGDAYMTPEGLKIFSGYSGKGAAAKFVDLRKSRLDTRERAKLINLTNAPPPALTWTTPLSARPVVKLRAVKRS